MKEIIMALIGALKSSGATSIILAILQRKWAKRDKQDEKVDTKGQNERGTDDG